MGFALLGLLLMVLKLVGLTGVAGWSWWLVLSPFGLAALWWTLADTLGYTRRAAMRREDDRVARRRQKQLQAMGIRSAGRSDKGSKRPDA